jgi:DNA-binding protein H-NS
LKQDRVLEAQQVLDLLKIQELDDYLRNVRGKNNRGLVAIELRPQEQQILENYTLRQDEAIKLGKELAQLRQIPLAERTPTQTQRIAELERIQQQIAKNLTTSSALLKSCTGTTAQSNNWKSKSGFTQSQPSTATVATGKAKRCGFISSNSRRPTGAGTGYALLSPNPSHSANQTRKPESSHCRISSRYHQSCRFCRPG